MRNLAAVGYLITALIYLYTWLRPVGGDKNEVLRWVSFGRIGPAEFVSLHAATLLGVIMLARADESTVWQRIARGRAILFTAAYYLLWSFVELKWPASISQSG